MSRVEFNDTMSSALLAAVSVEMQRKTEAIVAASVKEFEQELRRALARAVVVTLDKQLSVERLGTDLVFTVRHVYDQPK